MKRYNPHLAWLVSGRAIDLAMHKAGKVAGVNLFESNAMEAIASVDIPVLLIHGGKDVTIMPSCVQRIYDSRPENTELLFFPEESHAGLFGSKLDEIHRRCVALFDKSMKNAPV
ncbi:alpha/beta hydrolase family protein [bacterium BMS3Bbin04]|nr:alpha/beta hydrolase family protein [bacterium BMS3Bbin04]